MEEDEENDLDFIIKPCQIFPPQEEILRRRPFVRPMVNAPDGEESPESPAGIPVASVGITMLTLSQETTTTTTMTQDSCKDSGLPDDVFHTPPEQPSLPTSQLSEYAEAADSMDLSDDGELGFAQVKVKKQSGDSPLKEVENSEQDLGFDSSQNAVVGKEMPIMEMKSHDVEERVEIDESLEGICEAEKFPCSEGNEIAETCEGKKTDESGDKQPENHELPSSIDESLEGICEAEKLPCSEGNKIDESGDKQPENQELPSSIDECLENKAKENENGKCGRFVFDVLKAIVKDISEDDSPEHVSFLELAKARGVNFPRQRWRRQNDDDMTRTED